MTSFKNKVDGIVVNDVETLVEYREKDYQVLRPSNGTVYYVPTSKDRV